MILCPRKLAWYAMCIFTSMAVSWWIGCKYSCTIYACASMCPVLSHAGLNMVGVYSICLCSCMHGWVCMHIHYMYLPLQATFALLSWCGLSAGDLAEIVVLPNMLLACFRSQPHSQCCLLTSQVCFMASIQDINMRKMWQQHMSSASDSPLNAQTLQ